ncbi:MAG: threonine/serine dehydratase [Mycobacteriales bacterium]
MPLLSYEDVRAAGTRIRGHVRPVAVADFEEGGLAPSAVSLCLEHLQHTGSFKARGALNFSTSLTTTGSVPDAGVTIASGGNAGLACAWAARASGIRATVFVPETAPTVKVQKLRRLQADVRLVGSSYGEALEACQAFAADTGAIASHAYDHPLIAAGAGTLVDEVVAVRPEVTTLVVAVGGGGLFAGAATAANHLGLRVVAVEPTGCRALAASLEAGRPVDVEVQSIAADSLGARRVSQLAFDAARTFDVVSVIVEDEDIVSARRRVWDNCRLAVEHGAATALAALLCGAYQPAPTEKVAVVLCGANTDPGDLVATTP